MNSPALVPLERIEKSILLIRRQKVILDADLAVLYGVTTKRLNEQVKRNRERFPPDFMFQLSSAEYAVLQSQNATSKTKGGRRALPYAFTEHGALMVSAVLKTTAAVETSIQIVRVFVRLREMLSSHKELAEKLNQLEKKYDSQFRIVFDAIRKLMEPPEVPEKKRKIGFRVE